MWQKQPSKSCFRESVEALEAHLQHANDLAAALPQQYCGDCVQMRLSYSPLAPFLLHLIEWTDFRCTDALPNFLGLLHILVYRVYVDGMPTMSSEEKTASLREFYAVIYPSLVQLEGELGEKEINKRNRCRDMLSDTSRGDDEGTAKVDKEFDCRDGDCGICMEICSDNMVLPNCGHSLCIECFHEWNSRSPSCPFCRTSLKKVSSNDLWVLITSLDVVDTLTIAKENIRRFYLYIESLPSTICDTHIFIYDYII